MTEPFRWDHVVDEGGLPAHLPMGVTEEGQGPTDDDEAHHFVCWCADPKCALTKALDTAWQAGRRMRRQPCGGCEGLGNHRKHCRHNPEYTYARELADAAETLGDRIGPNNMGASNHCYVAASILRSQHKHEIEER